MRSSSEAVAQSPNRHWAEAYVGRAYIEGRFDCADLVVLVMRERFGVDLVLPAHAAGVRARDAQIAALEGRFAAPADEPREGDAVLMRAAGRKRALGHHIGVWCEPGVPHVLHCLKGIGVCLHPLRALHLHGLEAAGAYRWL